MRWRLSVCRGDDCRAAGADEVFRTACAEAARMGISPDRCRVARAGCYGLCHLAPNIVLREADLPGTDDPLDPGNYRLLLVAGEFHYAHMNSERVRRVLAGHVACGEPVEELLCPPEARVRPK